MEVLIDFRNISPTDELMKLNEFKSLVGRVYTINEKVE